MDKTKCGHNYKIILPFNKDENQSFLLFQSLEKKTKVQIKNFDILNPSIWTLKIKSLGPLPLLNSKKGGKKGLIIV